MSLIVLAGDVPAPVFWIGAGALEFRVPQRFDGRLAVIVIADAEGISRGPAAFHLKSIIGILRDRFARHRSRLIVLQNPTLEDRLSARALATEAVKGGRNVLVLETNALEVEAWCAFVAKHLVAQGR